MNTHQVTLNGRAIAIASDHFKVVTMVRSFEHQDADGNRAPSHELVMEGIDAFAKAVRQFVPPVKLKQGDVIQIVIGETNEA